MDGSSATAQPGVENSGKIFWPPIGNRVVLRQGVGECDIH